MAYVHSASGEQKRARLLTNGPLLIFFLFTVVALAGYATFGLHPQWLQAFPDLASFYGVAFPLFAQVHVGLAGVVLFFYLWYTVGWRWLAAFGLIYGVSFASEFMGTGYGIPFGPYGYTDLLGPQWFDRVPLLIPLSWFLMALPSYVIAHSAFPRQRVGRIGFAALLLVVWDLSLDPAMSYLTSYWTWGTVGPYYGMPLVNLVGWLVTGLVLMVVLHLLQVERWIARLSVRWMAAYYGLTLLMPLGMVLAAGLWGAVGATLGPLVVGAWIVFRRGIGPRAKGGGARHSVVEETTNGRAAHPADAMKRAASQEVISSLRDSVEATQNFFEHHSKSFSFAARWFPARQRRLIACLYAFCRTTDDLVDRCPGQSTAEVEKQLDCWLARARAAYDGRPSGVEWLDEIMQASSRMGAPFKLVEELVAGVRMDVGSVALKSSDGLDVYTYRVASVVGIWMCYLFGVRDAETLDRAAAMGRAMQITNIIRDVGEDLKQDRVYLPADMMARHGVTRRDLESMADGAPISPAYRALIQEMMARADAAYAYAFPALRDVPTAFARSAAVAAEVYRGIHGAVRRNGFDNIRCRAYTGSVEKGRLALRGLYRLRRAKQAPVDTWRLSDQKTTLARLNTFMQRMFLVVALVGVSTVGLSLSSVIQQSEAAPPRRTPDVRLASTSDPLTIQGLRDYYLRAVDNEAVIDTALAAIASSGRDGPVVEAYGAGLIILRAKHVFWPFRKMHYLREGLPVLDRLVEHHPEQAEIRYLRLLSCYFLPGFLGRTWSVEEDFEALTRLLPEAEASFPTPLYHDMVQFVLDKGSLGPEARARLQPLVAEEEPDTDERHDASAGGT